MDQLFVIALIAISLTKCRRFIDVLLIGVLTFEDAPGLLWAGFFMREPRFQRQT